MEEKNKEKPDMIKLRCGIVVVLLLLLAAVLVLWYLDQSTVTRVDAAREVDKDNWPIID